MKLQYICLYIHLSLTVMDDVSVKLYKYMCDEVVGSEKVVSYRRQFFKVYDDVQNHRGDSDWHIISSGSKAEGLDLPGSDFDVMFINTLIHVYERNDVLSKYHDLRTEYNLVLDFDNAVPGFTLLRIYDVREWKTKVIDIHDNEPLFSNKLWKRALKGDNMVINRPCFSDKLGTTDRAFCLRYSKWPSKARQ